MSEEIKGLVIVYSKIGCAQCMKAKVSLGKLGIPYTDVSLDSFPQCRVEMEQKANNGKGKTIDVPQIFFNEVHIGGNDELQALVIYLSDEKNILICDTKRFDLLMEMLRTKEASNDAPKLPNPNTAIDCNIDSSNGNDEFVIVSDEYSRLVQDMKRANLIRDNRVGLIKTYKNSFKGQEFVDWLVKDKNIDRKRALEIGQELIDRHFGQQTSNQDGDTFSPDRYYQLLEDDENQALNAGTMETTPIKIADFNESLRKLMTSLFERTLSNDGRTIDYNELSNDVQFEKYLILNKELQRVDVENGSRSEKLALFINVFNMMVIHATVKLGAPGNIWQRRKFFNTVYYLIGGQLYSMQSISNGVLRGNRKGVGMLWKPFGKNDARLPIALPNAEPLIHFALNIGTKSSPPIRVYSVKDIDEELKQSAQNLLNRDEYVKVDKNKNAIYLCKTFKWFAEDFGSSNEKIIGWLLDHMADGEKKKNLTKLFYTGVYTVDYLNYDWTHNNGKL